MKYSTHRTCLTMILLALALGVSGALGATSREDPVYQRADSWEKTLTATKAAYWQAVEKGRLVPYQKGYWYATKPFKTETIADNPVPPKSVDMKSKDARKIWPPPTRRCLRTAKRS